MDKIIISPLDNVGEEKEKSVKRSSLRPFTLTCFILTLAAIFVFAFGKSDVQAAGQQTEIELGRTYTIDVPYTGDIDDIAEYDKYILNGQSIFDVYKVTVNYISGEGICNADMFAASSDQYVGQYLGDTIGYPPISKYHQSKTNQFSLRNGYTSRKIIFRMQHPVEGMEGYDPERDYEPQSGEEYEEWQANDYLKGQTMKISFRFDLVPDGEEDVDSEDSTSIATAKVTLSKKSYIYNGE